ncbi:MAG: TetR/AcrR family transcriptional regulator [Verrucomicrobium sp.]|nr:TetR/AcrR family transcriptional regulator [Verrucomicrobium sp.]
MRYDKGHKETTRRRIVETAAREFRLRGIGGIGIAELMQKAGLTHGGFYSHFGSKDELVVAALHEAFAQSRAHLPSAGVEGGLEMLVRYYLSPAHRDCSDGGCAAAGLVGGMAQESEAAGEVFSSNLQVSLTLIAALLPDTFSAQSRQKTAAALFATLVGALQLARATVNADPAASQQILDAGIEGALTLARMPQG